jgi:hypothetical protein
MCGIYGISYTHIRGSCLCASLHKKLVPLEKHHELDCAHNLKKMKEDLDGPLLRCQRGKSAQRGRGMLGDLGVSVPASQSYPENSLEVLISKVKNKQ